MKEISKEEFLTIKNDLFSSKSSTRRNAAKKIKRNEIVSLAEDLLKAYLEERKDVRTWETQTEMIKALGKIHCQAVIPYLKEIVDADKDMDTITIYATLEYIRLTRRNPNDMSLILNFLKNGGKSVFTGAVFAMAFDDVIPTKQQMIEVLNILDKERAVYNNPYVYPTQHIISSMYKWPNEMILPFLQHYIQYPQYVDFIENTLSEKKSCKE